MSKKIKKIIIIFVIASIIFLVSSFSALYFASTVLINIYSLATEPSPMLTINLLSYAEGSLLISSKIAIFLCFAVPALVIGWFIWETLKPEKKELHGSARLGTTQDLKKAGLLSPDKPEEDKYPSVILGKTKGEFLLCRGQQFIFLSAPTGSGKGVGVVLPNCLHYRDSLVILDIKGENFTKTAGFRSSCGQKVYKFAPGAEDFKTDCWNPLSYVRDDPLYTISDLMSITTILYPPSDDDVWSSTSESLFIGLAMYTLETSKLKTSKFNIAAIKKLAVNLDCIKDEETFMREVANRKDFEPLSEDCVTHLRTYAQTSDKVRNSILISFNKPLGIFSDPITAKATSSDTFDFRDVRKKRISIYVVIPPNKIAKFGKLLNLFFEQLLNVNMAEEPADNPDLKYQCLLLLDEFAAMGRVGIIEKASAFMRSYNMRLLLIFQSKGQLKDQALYGDNGTENLLSNMSVQIAFPPRSDADAKDYSDMIGQMTYKSTSTSRNANLLADKANRSKSVSDQSRAVLLPQEIKALGEDKCIISMVNVVPAVVDKIFWYEEPIFIAREGLLVPDIANQMSSSNYIEQGRPLISPKFSGIVEDQSYPEGATYEVGFSPKRNALEVVMSLIVQAERELLVAAYSFTNKEIAHALVEAKERGVDVRVVVDDEQNGANQNGYKAIDYLESKGVVIFKNSNYSAMHHKFTVADGKHVQLGSFNYTNSANTRNAETAIVSRNVVAMADLFKTEWLRLATEPKVSPDAIRNVDRGREILKKAGLIF